ncbi:hypothetical protein SNK03_013108 [Fusarium graminearum]|uniref:Uncharacterized protein n=1 Tax=Gibberella zeae TaxID=5518 RepID=A0A2H3GGY1_GIBZA|nr:hypothetical protein FGRA07_10499 [Fusarium graminearum]CAG1980387.1 unnamed protein product [Fusarium graminearum]
MRLMSFITVLGAALIPAASARPANCRPQRPTTTSGVSTSITTSVVDAETSNTDAAPTTLMTSSETPNVIETTEAESSTATSDITRAVSESGSVTTAVETTITESTSDTITLITTATTTAETNPTEVSTTESTGADQTSSAATTTIATITSETTIADTTTGEQTTVQTTTAETAATGETTTTSETTTAAESTTTTKIPTTTTAAPKPTTALQNGGFEDAMDSAWIFQSGEIITDPNLAHSGSNFAKIDIRNEQAGGQQHIEQITSTSNTKQYTLSYYATFLSTPNMKLGNGCYIYALQDSSLINAPTFYLNADTLNSYQRFTHTFTPYNNNFLLSLRVRCSRGMATTFSVAIDDVSIVEAV